MAAATHERRALLPTVLPREPSKTSFGPPLEFSSEEDRSFYQQRLGTSFGTLAAIFLAFYALAIGVLLANGVSQLVTLTHPDSLCFELALVVLIVAWFICRGAPRSARTLAALDLVGMVFAMTMCALGEAQEPAAQHHDQSPSAFLLLLIILRAAVVPSAPRWTLVVSSASAVPLLVRSVYSAFQSGQLPMTACQSAVSTFMWSTGGVVATYIVSRTIYGLRAQVRDAMLLGQYRLEEKIGEGGMGVVYRASHAFLRRPTAIKLLAGERVGEANIRRFEREVQNTSRLKHPNTVAIYDFGRTNEGIFYYAMELLDGTTLEELVAKEGPQPPARVVHVLGQIAGALAEAHDLGLVHRDIKPANVMVSERAGLRDFVTVLDFGLVKEQGTADPALTAERALLGTPLYMAPESIATPGDVDGRADLYALGAVGYYLLTGHVVFTGDSVVQVCSKQLYERPVPPSDRLGAQVPPSLEAFVLRCLEKSRDARPSAREAVVTLRAIGTELPA